MTQAPDSLLPRRRILYIRHRRGMEISGAFAMNQDEWAEALALHADVTQIRDDFDMDEICGRVAPDFILYESPGLKALPLNIANPRAHPHIPRFGFQMQDTYCNTRVNFLRVIETLGIRYIFSHMTEAALRQSPEMKSRTFSLSLLFDDKIFYDYGLKKDIPISIFGGFLAPEIYQWRAQTAFPIAHRFPTLIYTHPGYLPPIPRHAFPVIGADYARLLSRSHFSLADTTRIDCLVRKHLEIPASGAVLIAPDAPVLKPYGFRDMENCILGSGDDLFDKIAAVADNPDFYEKIRKNGRNFVHGRYSRRHWRGIIDFYECWRTLKPGETIRQQGILGCFTAAPETDISASAITADYPESEISAAVNDWLASILNGTLAEAEAKLSQMSDWLPQMTEQWVPLGIMALLKGDPAHAIEFFKTAQALRKQNAGFADYDPEEIGWLSLATAMTGDAAWLKMTQQQSSLMRHLTLRRMQWLGKVLAAGGDASNPPPDIKHRAADDYLSIHWMSQLPIEDWLRLMRRILDANGQSGLLK